MCAILSSRKMNHAINAGESGSSAAVSVWVEFLLGEDVAAGLWVNNDTRLDPPR